MESNKLSSIFFQKAECLIPGELYLFIDYLAPSEASNLYDQVKKEVPWEQTWITIYGKSHRVPRLVSWNGDRGLNYSYSGQTFSAPGWTPNLKKAKYDIEKALGAPFNSVLANFYPEGRHNMGWHSDNEPELGERPIIASLSLGQSRRFLIRSRNGDKGQPSKKLDLTSP